MKIFKRLFFVFLILFILLFAALFFMVYTTTGLQIITTTVEKFVPQLQVKQVTGRLSNLSLLGVTYKDKGIDVNAEKANLAISGGCLLSGHICIKNIVLENATITVDTSLLPKSPDKDKPPLTAITTPVPLVLEHLQLNNITTNVDGIQIKVDEFTSSARWTSRQVVLNETALNGFSVIMPEKSQEKETVQKNATAPSKTLNETLNELFNKPLIEKLPLESMPIFVDIQGISGKAWTFKLPQELRVNDFFLKGKVEEHNIVLESLKVVNDDADIAISGDTQFIDNWPVKLAINATLFNGQDKQSAILASLTGNVLAKLALEASSAGLIESQLALTTQLSHKDLPTSLKLRTSHVQWPLTAQQPDYQLSDIILTLDGDVKKYQLSAKTSLVSDAIPVTHAELTGTGNLSQFSISELTVDALEGTVKTAGTINWADKLKWNADLNVNAIDIASFIPDYPAVLNGKTSSNGYFSHNSDWAVQINNLVVTGKMDKQKIDIAGDVNGDAKGNWDIKQLHAIWGDNTLTASGNAAMAGKLDLKAAINAKNLSQILPELGGSISGNVFVKGTYNKPTADVDLAINKLKWQEWLVQSAKLTGDVASNKEIGGNLSLSVDGLKSESVAYKKALVTLKGTMSSHQLTVNADGEPVKAQLAVNGRFDDQKKEWTGVLQQAKFDTGMVGELQLSKPASIQYKLANHYIAIGDHCWMQKEASICVPKTFTIAPNGGGEITVNKINLRMLNQFLRESGVRLNGELQGSIKAKWGNTLGIPDADFVIGGENLTVASMVGMQMLPIRFDKVSASGKLSQNALVLNLLTKLKDNGDVTSQININDLAASKRLSGNFNVNAISLSLLNPLLQEHDVAKGLIKGGLTFAGTLTDPTIQGVIDMTGINLAGSWLPTEIKDGNVSLRFSGKQSTLTGKLIGSSGDLAINGSADWRKMNDWFAELSAKGNNLLVSVPPMAELKISPDLSLQVNAKSLNIKGKVDIPWARIEVEGLPEGAVDISSDEVMLDENLQPKQKRSAGMLVNGNIALNIGDDVELKAYGLIAKLKGQLLVRQEKQNLGLHGTIVIPEGRFHAYGQDLLIKKGELIFAGPVDQPRLNIEAIRNPDSIEDNVTAGLRVTGLADEPKIDLFSEPSLSQQEILSYILSGQSLSSSGGGNNDTITALLIGFSAAKGGQYIGKLGEAFGIKNLGIDTQGVGSSSQVVVSGNITPNLQVKYGIGIFDALATITIRYRLLPKLYLEAVSSLDQTVDLIYQFEF